MSFCVFVLLAPALVVFILSYLKHRIFLISVFSAISVAALSFLFVVLPTLVVSSIGRLLEYLIRS